MKMHDVKMRVWTIFFVAFLIEKKTQMNTKNTRDSDQTPLAGRTLNQSQLGNWSVLKILGPRRGISIPEFS